MDIAISSGLNVGIQALNLLNKWLEEVEIAKSWYGEDKYPVFTQRLFTIKKDKWEEIIQNSLSCCSSWHYQVKKHNVLALANGARIYSIDDSSGGYFARLDARDFVLTIWQMDITGSATAHIAPRESPSDSSCLSPSGWRDLLHHGYSFGEYDHVFGWPFKGTLLSEPPEALLVIDDHRARYLQEKLRCAIHQCYDKWTILKRSLPCTGRDNHEFEKWDKKIEVLQRNLLKSKLLLVDGAQPYTPFLEEERIGDTLSYAEHQLKEPSDRRETVVALTRLLTTPRRINKFLSTRESGKSASLV
ncbi:hypothetical protein BO86DRAFT_419962 [Aspergillus japonicus CBS 114.51]|uniref:Uncharacterized protein n=1 Tax=Aspergillus japonicus CBS 114.51 TaxID=1448312 RepID=A0A8T8WXQ8_ASPJA|nr:hypothetical protein BO86DRAFT_419962 [Aspergillus japonicus CBS 114.51]RAH80667.1 hypothetical protein BO86DRAFT_419962 [Aspergillus japonicus CBS 114.51]